MVAWLIIAALAAVGAVLFTAGLRGRRIDDHPVCRKCGFDLVGTVPLEPLVDGSDATVAVAALPCPECGASLSAVRSIRFGHRRRRTAPLVLGAFLILLVAAGGGVLTWTRYGSVDWNTIKPDWLLARELAHADPVAASDALNEALRRATAGTLSGSAARRITDRAVAIQAAAGVPWNPDWAHIVEAARGRGLIDDVRWRAYVRAPIRLTVELSRGTWSGGGDELRFSCAAERGPRDAGPLTPVLDVTREGLFIDGLPWRSTELSREHLYGQIVAPMGSISTIYPAMRPVTTSYPWSPFLAPGEHRLTTPITIRATSPNGDLIDQWTTTLTLSVTVDGIDPSLMAADPALAAAVDASVSIAGHQLALGRDTGPAITPFRRELRCDLVITNPPVSLAMEVLAVERIENLAGQPPRFPRAWQVYTIAVAKGKTVTIPANSWVAGLDVDRVDVLMRPLDPTKSFRPPRTDGPFWARPILIRDVPIVDVQPQSHGPTIPAG